MGWLSCYSKESPYLSNTTRKRCVSLPGRFFFFHLILIWFVKPVLSLCVSLSFFLKRKYFSLHKTASYVHRSRGYKYLNFSKMHHFKILHSSKVTSIFGGSPRGALLQGVSHSHHLVFTCNSDGIVDGFS